MAGGRSPYEEKVETIAALRADIERFRGEIETEREGREQIREMALAEIARKDARIAELTAALREVPHTEACRDYTFARAHADRLDPETRDALLRAKPEYRERCGGCRALAALKGEGE